MERAEILDTGPAPMIVTATRKLSSLALTVIGAALVFAAVGGVAHADFVPEIDPGSMASAVTLLTGGLFMLAGRRAR